MSGRVRTLETIVESIAPFRLIKIIVIRYFNLFIFLNGIQKIPNHIDGGMIGKNILFA